MPYLGIGYISENQSLVIEDNYYNKLNYEHNFAGTVIRYRFTNMFMEDTWGTTIFGFIVLALINHG